MIALYKIMTSYNAWIKICDGMKQSICNDLKSNLTWIQIPLK
jgi:hypothetical protein